MKKILLLLALFATFIGQSQTTTDFENFNINPESALNGSDGNGGFVSGNMFFPNDYNATYDSWSGWAISNTTDVTTAGFMNPFSAITGGGHDNSETYGISFVFGESYIGLQNEAMGGTFEGMYVTNSTWSYFSMLNGDDFAKAFGGITGSDPDYFLLTVKKIRNGVLSQDSVDFYLADYRFEDNSQDYIINEWTYLDLSSLGEVDSLVFTMSSTDNGTYGMNTPAFFCIDNGVANDAITSTNAQLVNTELEVSPNPTTQWLNIGNLTTNSTCNIYNMQGLLLLSQKTGGDRTTLDVSNLTPGAYALRVSKNGVIRSKRFVKQ